MSQALDSVEIHAAYLTLDRPRGNMSALIRRSKRDAVDGGGEDFFKTHIYTLARMLLLLSKRTHLKVFQTPCSREPKLLRAGLLETRSPGTVQSIRKPASLAASKSAGAVNI